MRKIEVSELDRRLVRLLMRWKRATVSSIARSAKVDHGSLSRLVGDTGTPGLGAAKFESVTRELGWSSAGPSAGTVARWTLDTEGDVVWMFKEVLRGEAQVAVLVNGEKALDLLDHMGVLLCYWGTSLIVLDAVRGEENLIDQLLGSPELARRRAPVIIESASKYTRVAKGIFHIQELDEIVSGGQDAFTVPEPLAEKLWYLFQMLGSDERLDALIHDVQILMARTSPGEHNVDLVSDLINWRFGHLPTAALIPAKKFSMIREGALSISERQARDSFHLPWLETISSWQHSD